MWHFGVHQPRWFVLRSEDSSFYSFRSELRMIFSLQRIMMATEKQTPPFLDHRIYVVYQSSSGGTTIQQFGASGDVPTVADYDGDNKADISIYRPSEGQWWILRSSLGAIAYQFGASTDKPVQGDYTGDGKTDVAFWRPSSGEWFVLRSEDNSFYSFPFGAPGDVPSREIMMGDVKRTRRFRPSSNTWLRSVRHQDNTTNIRSEREVPFKSLFPKGTIVLLLFVQSVLKSARLG